MSTSWVDFPLDKLTAAAIPAPWPVTYNIKEYFFSWKWFHEQYTRYTMYFRICHTVQAIIFLIAAWDVLSPATHLPATRRFFIFGGTIHPYGTYKSSSSHKNNDIFYWNQSHDENIRENDFTKNHMHFENTVYITIMIVL